ncbi:hypothetical protein A3H80_01120 [Candidatus Roizmanbacteria bacterium RIFCSPLOWO2_02_FULL_37_19]|uniref:Uncharacterized protein n=1 Tax=Candidatus Roizmanbacteria bacterium RIFCSPHIGHO2_02_FULL_37_24 TaxID=1802037 RepID=A0A1F7GUA6_9BACT|nr:MAG: hypothetical protein A2862_00675 [Candidatus Roizmanbacteria bacterium RIFCSPHIGHO2_01_FULL_38_41]OGK22538.1 MAG: hypothetical protein A3C24_05240 [Candidatus Roizmanbacteria bacterium RIFCSPHIGHO2_02_FULL_37_24]OGK33938.1 MAG: hypothetical protein A3E10_02025 [Candidatus Roizmanbacteria bacterium RIFCSPHIGHO2_12_FULL_37_23]OGK43644.1 MAG: hypothetical protein A2956_04040 [Candidatus Roizmanbacteria bacterium RIFCSPLOWO2_01_FULL_37_57]OGK54201.1 MAG: hypothetical protein A3H80_01120 [Ca
MLQRIKRINTYNFLFKIFSRVEKRQRFIISTFFLTLLFLSSTFFSFEQIYLFIPLIIVVVFALTFFSILEGISGHEWYTLFVHPIYFSIVFYLFYFFVPQRWLTRLPFVVIYTIAIYAILLSQNIFNVGASKSLQLFRAAFSVNYLFVTLSAFLSFSLIISLRMNFIFNFFAVLLACLPLTIQLLWSVAPSDKIKRELWKYAFIIALIIAEASVVFSFIPLNQSIFALILTAIFYSLVGLVQVYLQEALFKERIREYLIVLGFTTIIFILSLRW